MLTFYTMPEYEAWKEEVGRGAGKWKVKYYKGLGTSSRQEGMEYFHDLIFHRKELVYEGTIQASTSIWGCLKWHMLFAYQPRIQFRMSLVCANTHSRFCCFAGFFGTKKLCSAFLDVSDLHKGTCQQGILLNIYLGQVSAYVECWKIQNRANVHAVYTNPRAVYTNTHFPLLTVI